jgi:hypothetical protein
VTTRAACAWHPEAAPLSSTTPGVTAPATTPSSAPRALLTATVPWAGTLRRRRAMALPTRTRRASRAPQSVALPSTLRVAARRSMSVVDFVLLVCACVWVCVCACFVRVFASGCVRMFCVRSNQSSFARTLFSKNYFSAQMIPVKHGRGSRGRRSRSGGTDASSTASVHGLKTYRREG